ncbi:MAG: hypothetical protein VB078_12360 [Clostridiaceae bacterium]|nr:hypothetical protein [Clostridiaceae bacterium]
MADYIYNRCPICGRNKSKRLGPTDHGKVISGVPTDAGIAKCLQCRSVYANPLPVWSDDDFAAMCNVSYFDNEQPTHDQNINVIRRFQLIEKYRGSKAKHLLEFEAGIFAGMPNMPRSKASMLRTFGVILPYS